MTDWPTTRVDTLRQLFNDGLTLGTIAAQMGASYYATRWELRKLGLQRYTKPPMDERKAETLRKLHAAGMTMAAIGERIGAPFETVRTRLKRLGLRRYAESPWDDRALSILRTGIAEGASSAEIAAEIGGGMTRNAVIGKSQRMGLARGGRMKPRQHRPGGQGDFSIAHNIIRRRKERRTEPDLAAYVPPPPPANAPPPRNLTILDLARGDCRWAVTDSLPHLFCGHPAGELPYCRFHARIAYQPPRPRR